MLPITLDWQVAWLPRLCQVFYSARPDKRISSNKNSGGWRVENSLPNKVRPFRVSGHVFWSFQYPCQLPRIHQQNFSKKTWYFRHYLPWWYFDLYQRCRPGSYESCLVVFWRTPETRLICQPEKVSFSSRKSSLSRLRRI